AWAAERQAQKQAQAQAQAKKEKAALIARYKAEVEEEERRLAKMDPAERFLTEHPAAAEAYSIIADAGQVMAFIEMGRPIVSIAGDFRMDYGIGFGVSSMSTTFLPPGEAEAVSTESRGPVIVQGDFDEAVSGNTVRFAFTTKSPVVGLGPGTLSGTQEATLQAHGVVGPSGVATHVYLAGYGYVTASELADILVN